MTRMSSSINIPKKAKRKPGWLGVGSRIMDVGAEPTRGDVTTQSVNGQAAGKFYGTGVRAKLGKLRDGTMLPGNPVKKDKLKTPPRSLV